MSDEHQKNVDGELEIGKAPDLKDSVNRGSESSASRRDPHTDLSREEIKFIFLGLVAILGFPLFIDLNPSSEIFLIRLLILNVLVWCIAVIWQQTYVYNIQINNIDDLFKYIMYDLFKHKEMFLGVLFFTFVMFFIKLFEAAIYMYTHDLELQDSYILLYPVLEPAILFFVFFILNRMGWIKIHVGYMLSKIGLSSALVWSIEYIGGSLM